MHGYELGNEPAVWNYTWRTPIVTPAQQAKARRLLAFLKRHVAVERQDKGEPCAHVQAPLREAARVLRGDAAAPMVGFVQGSDDLGERGGETLEYLGGGWVCGGVAAAAAEGTERSITTAASISPSGRA